jgi:hypothetical protein
MENCLGKKSKNECDHFWELVFPVEDWDNPKWKCMKCPKTKRGPIPILYPEAFSEDDKK